MKRHWYVVANAARARVLERTDAKDDWADVADLVHPASRTPAAVLTADRSGHVEGAGHGTGGAAYRPHTEPRQHEHEQFAREIAALVDAAIADGRCDGLVVVASNPFLGVLRHQLDERASRLVRATVAHDWTLLPDAELVAKLREAARPD
jgi:protein required for attachment to host cells